MVTQMRKKGQITIPADIRASLHLSEDALLSVARVGNGILLTPQPSVFEDVSKKFAKTAKLKDISLAGLLKDLKNLRKEP